MEERVRGDSEVGDKMRVLESMMEVGRRSTMRCWRVGPEGTYMHELSTEANRKEGRKEDGIFCPA